MYNPIWKRILQRGEQYRNRVFVYPNQTFFQILQKTNNLSSQMYSQTKKPWNNRVIIQSPTNTIDFMVELFSIWRNDRVPCLIPDYYNQTMKKHCIDLLKIREQYPDEKEGLILFTTGTSSGKPKGVRLSKENVVRQMEMLDAHVPQKMLNSEDRTLSMMPWYHSYGLCELLSIIDRGCSTLPHTYTKPISYWLNIQYIQPTVLFTVPRLLEMIKDKIESSPVLYESLPHDLLRSVWFGKSIRHIISGGAILRQDVKLFYCNRMGLPIYSGYGCTEMCPMISLETSYDPYNSHIGSLLPNIWIEDRVDGLIFVNGPNRFMGYLGERLLKPMDYYNTGDIGSLIDNKLYIHGRQSNKIKLSNGKFINLVEIESSIKDQLKVQQVCVLKIEIDKDPIAVIFDSKINVEKPPEFIRICDNSVIIQSIRVPSSWLTKDMISLKGELLKHEIINMLKIKIQIKK